IERGYLYIAQPPLYGVKRSKSLVYCKDDRALEEMLIDQGYADMVLVTHDGAQIAGNDLRAIIDQAREIKHLLDPMVRKVGNADVVEQVVIAGAMNAGLLEDPERAAEVAGYIATRLDVLSPDYERGWSGAPTADGGLELRRTLRGVTETRLIDRDLLHSGEARRLDQLTAAIQDLYSHPAALHLKEQSWVVRGPVGLFDKVMELGRKGISIQRYKGLGEMNPDQLWDTTLDPDHRALLQVKISHADDAAEVFATLMGDVVEPRREFIQDNALNVANLDI
ncbi:MAG: DNA gyrase subunit B, partial [Rhodospirillaceae bacterium]|nr:DNA gyrase subunit B [Rhodospirillaceae bacterium]